MRSNAKCYKQIEIWSTDDFEKQKKTEKDESKSSNLSKTRKSQIDIKFYANWKFRGELTSKLTW